MKNFKKLILKIIKKLKNVDCWSAYCYTLADGKYEGRIGGLSSRLVNRWKPISFTYFKSVSNVLVFHAKKLEKEGVNTEQHLEDLLDINDGDIRAQDLLNSGIGDVVKMLKKRGGKIGKIAQELTKRWRRIIIKSFESDESDETETEKNEIGKTGIDETESIFEDVTSNKRKLSMSDEEGNKSEDTNNVQRKKRKEDKETDKVEDETIKEKESGEKEKETINEKESGEKEKTKDSINEVSEESMSIEQLFAISNGLLQDFIEKEGMEEQINDVLDRLESIPKENIKCEDLYMTGIGKTLNKLKNMKEELEHYPVAW